MQKQKYIYLGVDTLDKIDVIADAIDALPYEALYSQFEGNEEIFFTFLVNAMDEEYASTVTSCLSFQIDEDKVEVDIITTSPSTDMGMENLALIKQMQFWDAFFKGHQFKDNENQHEHHEHHHDCDCEKGECDCGDECTCHHEHQIH